MSFSGFKNHEIAEKLGMSQATISSILHSPLGKAYLDGLHDKSRENTLDVRKQLISMNSSALAAFERILNPAERAPHNVQANVAKDILDRNGFKPTDKINIDMTLQAKSDAEINAEINALTNSIAAAKSAASSNEEASESELELELELELESESEEPEELNLIEAVPPIEFTQDVIDAFPPK